MNLLVAKNSNFTFFTSRDITPIIIEEEKIPVLYLK
jgi:hypothetical protein